MGRRKVRYLAVTGVFFYLIAVANDRVAMYALSVGLFSLLLVAYALARITAHGLSAVRGGGLTVTRITAGQPLPTGLRLTNLGSLPKSGLLLTDRVVNTVRDERREETVLVGNLAGEATLPVTFDHPPARRGVAVLGPTFITAGDPLGLFEVQRELPGTRGEVLVHPRLSELPMSASAALDGADSSRSRRAASGFDLHGLREYVSGDDPRHVHWRASARRGRLMVKEFEQPSDRELVVLLDLQQRQVFGAGDVSSLEAAISAAGSLAAFQARSGRTVRLVAHEGQRLEWRVTAGAHLPLALLDGLARVRGIGQVSAVSLLRQSLDRLRPGGALVMVTAAAEAELLGELRALAEKGRDVQLILLDAAAFAAVEGRALPDWCLPLTAVGRFLYGDGVRLTVLGPGADLLGALADGLKGVA